MIDMDVKVTLPDIKIENAGQARWLKIAIESAKNIRVRTETDGKDTNEKSFRPYSAFYKKRLLSGYYGGKSRPQKAAKPNLSLSGKMLGAMVAGANSTATSGKIRLTGGEGHKAIENEQRGREFLGLTDKQADSLAGKYADLIIDKLFKI
ncbi:MAG: hypothetical protein P1P74_12520 [Desulfuromonadales bacterium]|nr:hypothetical protein [Desulfuromonadales bacterium]